MADATMRRVIEIMSVMHEDWIKILHGEPLERIQSVLTTLMKDPDFEKKVSPEPNRIFAAFTMSPYTVRAGHLGMDPYPRRTQASGLAFDPRDGKYALSAAKIFAAIKATTGQATPPGCRMTEWPKQGVFMPNTALTTWEGKSGVHLYLWQPVMELILNRLCEAVPGIYFIRLGQNAQNVKINVDRKYLLDYRHPAARPQGTGPAPPFACPHYAKLNEILDPPIWWGVRPAEPKDYDDAKVGAGGVDLAGARQPSLRPDMRPVPQQRTAQIKAELGVKAAADVAKLVDEPFAGDIPLYYGKDSPAVRETKKTTSFETRKRDVMRKFNAFKSSDDPVPSADIKLTREHLAKATTIIFTDGSGYKGENSAAYAYTFARDSKIMGLTRAAAMGKKVEDGDALVGRSEMIAAVRSLEHFLLSHGEDDAAKSALPRSAAGHGDGVRVVIVSDSEYVVKTINTYLAQWKKAGCIEAKCNPDLIIRLDKAIETVKKTGGTVDAVHMYSHQDKPEDVNSENYFMWYYNNRVDILAKAARFGIDVTEFTGRT